MTDVLEPMRHVRTDRQWSIFAKPEPSAQRGVSVYHVFDKASGKTVDTMRFQDGPIKEVGVNGTTNEMVISAVIDRLEHFQSNEKTRCRENAMVITKLEEALHWLAHRTADRVARGVEGTYQK